jgi:uncharacterized protein YegP (UPF0339 family)
MRRKPRLQVYEIAPGLGAWRWRLRGANGKIVAASSESFANKASARRNIRTTMRLLARYTRALGLKA